MSLKTPYEELAEWPERGRTVTYHADRVTASVPVLGEMYSQPRDVLDRRTHEVEIQRAAVAFANVHRTSFNQWLNEREEATAP